MKLWYSNSSPYARKARAVVQYHQLQDHVELLLATSGLDKNSPHNLDNPLGRLPALQQEKLDNRIQRDFLEGKNKEFKNCLNNLLPQKMIDTVVELSKINPYKKVNEITREERMNLVKLLKNFTITISGFRPIEEGIVTSGGINVKEINPKTMESKIVNGLYFAGEIIDVDAYTGGFNLQIAYSTGFTAGSEC